MIKFLIGVYTGIWVTLLMIAIWIHFANGNLNFALGAMALFILIFAGYLVEEP